MSATATRQRPQQATEAVTPRYHVRAVPLVELPLLWPLIERFAETPGADNQTATSLFQMCAQRLQDPAFLLASVSDGTELVGFAAAAVSATPTEREVFILATYIDPGAGLGAGRALDSALCLWARAMQATRIGARTNRQRDGELTERRAWERLGYKPQSLVLYKDV